MQRAESKQGGVGVLCWNYHLGLVPIKRDFTIEPFSQKKTAQCAGSFLYDCSHVHLWCEGLCLDLGLSAVCLHPDGSQRQRPKSTD